MSKHDFPPTLTSLSKGRLPWIHFEFREKLIARSEIDRVCRLSKKLISLFELHPSQKIDLLVIIVTYYILHEHASFLSQKTVDRTLLNYSLFRDWWSLSGHAIDLYLVSGPRNVVLDLPSGFSWTSCMTNNLYSSKSAMQTAFPSNGNVKTGAATFLSIYW